MLRSARTWCGVRHWIFGATAVLVWAGVAHADEAAKIDTGDTAWMLTSSALVLMMTAPGLALFYGGLVRGKTIVGSLVCLAVTGMVTGGVRVAEDDEFAGLDLSQHSENAYVFGAGGYEPASPQAMAHSRRVRRPRRADMNEPRHLYRRAGVGINGMAAPARTQPEGHS